MERTRKKKKKTNKKAQARVKQREKTNDKYGMSKNEHILKKKNKRKLRNMETTSWGN